MPLMKTPEGSGGATVHGVEYRAKSGMVEVPDFAVALLKPHGFTEITADGVKAVNQATDGVKEQFLDDDLELIAGCVSVEELDEYVTELVNKDNQAVIDAVTAKRAELSK
jgi:hypothetical protein